MKVIPLRGAKAAGRVALVDDEDYELVIRYKWHVQEDADDGRRAVAYAKATINQGGKCSSILMHKLITGWARTDHCDHDGLNNQRYNLREFERGQNQQNQRKTTRPCSSQFKGVSWAKANRKWMAYINVDGRMRYLGFFVDEREAAMAYDVAALAEFGEFAALNLPKEIAL